MKKILICLLGAIILTNCDISPKKAKAQDRYFLADFTGGGVVQYTYKEWEGMRYMIVASYDMSIYVVNLTKDKLEVELLRKQLAK